MDANSFKSQGIQLQLGGRRMGGPALGPQGGGVPIVQQPEPTVTAPQGRTPVFSVAPSAPASAQATAPLGGSKIPSMRKSQAGGGARDAFTPGVGGVQLRLAGAPQAPIQTEQPPALERRPAPQPPQPKPQAELAGAEQIVLCEAIAEMPDGQQWAAPYEAVFPAGAKFLGVRTTKR